MPKLINCNEELLKSLTKLNERFKGKTFLGELDYPEDTRNIQYGKLTFENTPEVMIEKEAESILGMDNEEIIKEIKGYQADPTSFVEYLIGRKLSIQEKTFLEFSSMHSSLLLPIYPKRYKPPFFLENNISYTSLSHLLGIDTVANKSNQPIIVGCFVPLMIADEANRNLRLYDHEVVCGCLNIDKFIKELKLSGQWYILSPVKNKSEDLQFYKNIVYPWDDKDLMEIHHRMEIKIEGDNRYGIHPKSGRHNTKRSRMV